MTNAYKELFDSATVGLWRTTINEGEFLNVNSAVASILGYDDTDDLSQYRSVDLYDQDVRNAFIDELRELQEIEDFEVCMKKKDGTPIWVAISAKIYPEKGYLEGSIRDISNKKKQEENFAPHLQKLSLLKQNIMKRLQENDFKDFSRNKAVKIV